MNDGPKVAPALPPGVTVDEADASVTMTVPAEAYPLPALYGASYVFIDRCFVWLGRPSSEAWTITLSKKDPAAQTPTLAELAGEFANELLSCAWRHEITKNNRAVIEAVTMQAFGGAMGPPSLDELEAFDFSAEPFDDPLGIAQSWEDKYKKRGEAPAQSAGEGRPAPRQNEKDNGDKP